jgi:uncharacterized protein with beta-barrel porin domain
MAKKNYAVVASRMVADNPATTAADIRKAFTLTASDASVAAQFRRYSKLYATAAETGVAQKFRGNDIVSTGVKLTPEQVVACENREHLLIDCFRLFGGGEANGERGAKPFDMLSDL